jgi:hypothetical protein
VLENRNLSLNTKNFLRAVMEIQSAPASVGHENPHMRYAKNGVASAIKSRTGDFRFSKTVAKLRIAALGNGNEVDA